MNRDQPPAIHFTNYDNQWLRQQGHETAAIYSRMNSEHRNAIVEAFNNDKDIEISNGRVLGSSPDILIGTIDIIGIGFTCVRAFRLVLMGPEWLEKVEGQAMARIRRIGQCNPKTYTYRLICEDVKIEKGIVNRHELRKEFEAMATKIEQEVREGQTVDHYAGQA